jgi:SAM-dependent methyltransferase
MEALTKSEIEAEVARLGPFHHAIELPHGVPTQDPAGARGEGERRRIHDLEVGAWPAITGLFGGTLEGRSVLDVGCNSGGHSLLAVRSGAKRALGIDVVDRYVEQANFVKRALDEDALEFRLMAIEDVEAEAVGTFDLVLCFGVLFHLENPVLALRKLAAVTERAMVIDTNIASGKRPNWRQRIVGPPNPENLSTSLWRAPEGAVQLMPTESALLRLLEFLGFQSIERLPPHPDQARRYHKGTRATFIATR